MRYLGKRYNWEKDGDKVKFYINGKDGSEIREKSFFKYYALTDDSVDALTHSYIYATHPCQLNDPLDCADAIIEFDDFETTRILLGEMYSEVSDMYNNDERAIREFEKVSFRTYLYMKLGIFCLTKNSDDISMWSYYTSHKGFCVEFDIKGFPYDYWGPFPINYQKVLKPVSLRRTSLPLAMLIQTNVKLDCWKHEQEWRLLIQCPEEYYMEPYGFKSELIKESQMMDIRERKLNYSLECIKSIYLGIKFFCDDNTFITNRESEYVANDDNNKVLSFLARTKIPTYVLECIGLGLIMHPIKIIQIKDNIYQIIYRDNE